MPTKNHTPPLTRSELTFWKAAFLDAPFAPPMKGKHMAPEGSAQLAGEYADAAVRELRVRLERRF